MKTSDPVTENVIKLLGGDRYQSITVSKRQLDDMYHLYGFEKETDPILSPLLNAGSKRNCFRHAEEDGLRAIAFIAGYLSQGEDPVKLIAQLCIDAGYDIDLEIADWCADLKR